MPSVLIAAGTVVLLFGINAFTKCVAVVGNDWCQIGLITFAVFYANPLINTSFAELKYFLQVLICICAIMALEGKH